MAPAIPARSQRTTSRQSPSVERRKYSSGGLFSQSCSGVWAASLGLSWALQTPETKAINDVKGEYDIKRRSALGNICRDKEKAGQVPSHAK